MQSIEHVLLAPVHMKCLGIYSILPDLVVLLFTVPKKLGS